MGVIIIDGVKLANTNAADTDPDSGNTMQRPKANTIGLVRTGGREGSVTGSVEQDLQETPVMPTGDDYTETVIKVSAFAEAVRQWCGHVI